MHVKESIAKMEAKNHNWDYFTEYWQLEPTNEWATTVITKILHIWKMETSISTSAAVHCTIC